MIVKDSLSLENYKKAFQEIDWKSDSLKKVAENAFARVLEIGLPANSDEEWKYVQLEKLLKAEYPVTKSSELKTDSQLISEHSLDECLNVIIKNNTIIQKTEEVQIGVELEQISKIQEKYSEILINHFDKDYQLNSFKLLNSSFSSDTVFVLLDKNTVLQKPLHLLIEASSDRTNYSKIFILADKFSKAEIVVSFCGQGEYFTNSVLEIVLLEGANLKVSYVQDESHSAFQVANTLINLERNSELSFHNFTLGGNLSKHRIEAHLNDEGASCCLNGLYVLSDNNQAHNQIALNHHKQNCSSTQLYKGILDDEAHAEFSGTIYVAKHAIKTDAKQLNRNLLISPKAKVDTRPQLQIEADDVKCSHGASIGQLEDDQIFYLLSRGISKDQAKSLLTYGFAEEIIEKIGIKSLKQKLDKLFMANIHNF